MNPAPDDPNLRIAALTAEIDDVKRREAAFRAKMVNEFLDRGERNSYLHVLREELAGLLRRQQEAFADMELFTRMLEAEGQEKAALEVELEGIRRSWLWRLCAPLRASGSSPRAGSPVPPGGSPVKGGVFTYYLHTSPFRIYREPTFTLRGWAWPQDGRAVSAIRVDLDGRLFVGRHGLEEPEVIERHGPQPANPRPGFEVTFETPPGRHLLSLEAQLEPSEWRSIMKTSIWCVPPGA
jgi:hypothetical protein